MDRRTVLAGAAALTLPASVGRAAGIPLTIYTLEGCPCCKGWVTHMRRAGFAPTLQTSPDIIALAAKRGVKPEYGSCHMGVIDGYVVIGHVPPADVMRLIREKPEALGISVPGMPVGSPGMETPDNAREAYETLLLLHDGGAKVFARHA